MANHLYVRPSKETKSRLHSFLLLSLAVALVLASIILFLIARHQQNAEIARVDFEAALMDQDYVKALEIYREVQANAVQPLQSGQVENPYQQTLAEVESLLSGRLEEIENQLLQGKDLSAADQAFIVGLGELSGLRLSRFVRDLSRSYLMGDSEYTILSSTIEQLADLPNLKESVRPLSSEYSSWPALQPAFMAADQMLLQKQWYESYAAWDELANSAESGTFVQDFARQKLDTCKAAMYQPLLDATLDLISQNRAVTAYGQLQQLQVVFPGDQAILEALDQCSQNMPRKLETFRGAIEHLVIKPLIVDPATAFDQDPYSTAAFDTMLTTLEFARILEALHANDYILVDQTRLMTGAGERFALDLPEGKKPLVLVLEGLNYFATRRETGNCWDLQLNESGQVCGVWTGPDGNLIVRREAEAIGILDAFVEEHPDFSFDGAKGLITLSGYEGVFGMVTDPDQLDDKNQALAALGYPELVLGPADYEANRTKVQTIIRQLQRTGWQIGTSTYGMINLQNASLEQVQADWGKWMTQIAPLTGPVSALSFPNGAVLQADDPRRQFLESQGIRVFSGLGATPYIVRNGQTVYTDKVQVSGYSLTHPGLYRLERFFEANLIIDQEARSLIND